MSKFLALWALIKGTGPTFYLMAAAFNYGLSKYGDGTWRNETGGAHIDAAIREISGWRQGKKDWHALVDAGLRLAFSGALIVPAGAEYKK